VLSPRERQHLLDLVKPPSGFTLTDAIGTCYSLDLLALLTVPLAMTFFEWDGDAENASVDPLALLESLRRQSKRIDLFCQAGQIYVPTKAHRMFAYLEDIVHEAASPHATGSFHPKVWVLRFERRVTASTEVEYRFLCLSRNLTFDRSWDTALTLRGALADRERGITRSRPLADFIRKLPIFSIRALSEASQQRISRVAAELERVNWDCPEGFDDFEFSPLGWKGHDGFPLADGMRRVLIISPFLSDNLLSLVASEGTDPILISEPSALLDLKNETLQQFKNEIHVLIPDSTPSPDENDGSTPATGSVLNRLHAKILIADYGRESTLLVGSANATDAAYGNADKSGRNVEFCVALTGKRSSCGIDAFLDGREDALGFRSLLQRWSPPEDYVKDELEELMEEDLRQATQGILRSGFSAQVIPKETHDTFSLQLNSLKAVEVPPFVSIACWPMSLPGEAHARTLQTDQPAALCFDPISLESLTSFFSFRLRVSKSNRVRECQFVLNVPLTGTPADREQRLLRALLKDKDQVLRMILFLLADTQGDPSGLLCTNGDDSTMQGSAALGVSGAVFESLLHTLHKMPERIDHVHRLVEDLMKSPETAALLPDGFMDVWNPIWNARKEIRDER
jgi:hypothetical protein